ncbi:hypothetical protein DMC47_37140 [Nostoc sp. 3335mG]|nr:hypothetical protein DMC47_37140 [Nostoc sp. 3335mG]
MKKRNLLLLAVVYWMAAFMVVGFAVLTVGDCGIAVPTDRAACVHDGNVREVWGFVIATVGFPTTLGWYVRRCRKSE